MSLRRGKALTCVQPRLDSDDVHLPQLIDGVSSIDRRGSRADDRETGSKGARPMSDIVRAREPIS